MCSSDLRFLDVESERESFRVPAEQLLEAGLVHGHAAGAQLLDPLGKDVADDHLVPELREAGTGDEADIAGAEDGDPGHDPAYFLPAALCTFGWFSGCRPLAIAIMVSLESESRRVLTTQ